MHLLPRRILLGWLLLFLVLLGATHLRAVFLPPASAHGPAAAHTLFLPLVQRAASTPTPNTAHPRLLFGLPDSAAVRARASGSHAALVADVVAFAEAAPPIGTSIPTDAGSSDFRAYGDTLGALAFACLATERADLCADARQYLLNFVAWERWDQEGWRDFGLGHGLIGTALAYDWLYPHLSDSERAAVRAVLAERAAAMHAAATLDGWEWNNWWRRGYLQNHNHTNHTGLGLAGLALYGEESRAQAWIDTATTNMTRLRAILEQSGGVWQEGIFYGNYGISMSLAFTLNLRALHDIDSVPATFLRDYALWRTYNYLPGSREVLMAYGDLGWDWSHEPRALHLLRLGASEHADGRAEWIAQRIIEEMERTGRYRGGATTIHTAFEFFAYDPAVSPTSPDDLPLALTFPDLEGVIWRTGWTADDLVFGLKASPWGGRFVFDAFTSEEYPFEAGCAAIGCGIHGGHYHNDAGTFYLQRGPAVLAREYEAYDMSATSAHNTLLIDGSGQYRPTSAHDRDELRGSDPFLEISDRTTTYEYAAVDLTRPYQRSGLTDLADVTRHVIFVRPDYFVMVDSIVAAQPHSYEWRSHGTGALTQEGDWIRAEAGGEQVLGIQMLSGGQVAIGDDGRPFVGITVAGSTVRLIHLLVPTTQAAWAERPTATLLSDDGSVLTLDIARADGTHDTIRLDYAESLVIVTRP